MEKLNDTLLYTLDKCFRSYNQFAQRNVKQAGYDITIDQWLILKNVAENPNLTQNDISKIVFKDSASLTRIVHLLVTAGYLNKAEHPVDKRRTVLTLTTTGKKITSDVNEIAISNRAEALKGIGKGEIDEMKFLLNQIIENCATKNSVDQK
jgi:MarR family transcriptional regulator for hemolysin